MQDETRKGVGGRPRKKAGTKQAKRAMVTFTPAEWRDLKAAAGDKPIGTLIREIVLRYLARRRKK